MITQQHIQDLRQSLHTYIDGGVDSFIQEHFPTDGEKKDPFLKDLNRPVERRDTEQTTAPGIPDLADLGNDQPESETPPSDFQLVDPATWHRFAKTIILGGWTAEKLLGSSTAKSFDLTKGEKDRIKLLETTRAKLIAKQMTLEAAVVQDGIGEEEKAVLTQLALENGL